MHRLLRTIIATVMVVLLGSLGAEARKGVQYLDLPPYEALSKAQSANRMLLVEFYAPWNSRSSWMHDKVMADSAIGEFVNRHFVSTFIDTQSEAGAQLALDYQVFAYPTIVIFDTRGNVLDKIDVALDAEDFENRLLSVIMAADGSGGWQLRMCFSAIESGDIQQAHTYAKEYLDRHSVEQVINSVAWPLFSNNSITYYGSYTFSYMVKHLELMREKMGRGVVDTQLNAKLLDAMLPFAVQALEPDSVKMDGIVALSDSLQLTTFSRNLRDLVYYKQNQQIDNVITQTIYLIDHLPESMRLQLTLGLDIVAEKGSKEQRNTASKIVTQTIVGTNAPVAYKLLENLRSRLK